VRIDVITLFPEMFDAPLRTSLLGKAVSDGKLDITVHDLRNWGLGKHRTVDDQPYGGGAGMVMRPEPIFAAVENIANDGSHVILLSPRGSVLNQAKVGELSGREHVVLISGRYEGVDQRVSDALVHEELSIGDYVLAGGELPALVVIEAVSRQVEGVLGNVDSLTRESHADGTLEYPQYTRPAEFRGMPVPEILLSGDHARIQEWRHQQSEQLTRARRPDLFRKTSKKE
jgi:tRNA (guanine37-N1)-methyltransferase